jgi:predicted alpha/beta hydrolase family esterase
MKQLVFIHGGETFDTYDEYLAYLRAETYDPKREQQKRWKHSLASDLGEEWEVFAPTMPSSYNAKFLEWSIWFEKVIPYLNNGVILVGHSLGGIFLAKYLSLHEMPVKIAATFLIAAPYDTRDTDYTLADFALTESLDGLSKQGGRIFIWHSRDDEIVPFSAFDLYCQALPTAEAKAFGGRGHFLGEEFPELIETIRSIS